VEIIDIKTLKTIDIIFIAAFLVVFFLQLYYLLRYYLKAARHRDEEGNAGVVEVA